MNPIVDDNGGPQAAPHRAPHAGARTQPTIPERYRDAVIAHAMVDDAAAALAFDERAFGATELLRLQGPDGKIFHSEIRIGRAVVMVGDAAAPFAAPSATTPTAVGLHVYVDDVDAFTARAVREGAELLQPPADMFYGARQSMLRDPFGHLWFALTHTEDLTTAQIVERARHAFGDGS